VGTSQRRSCGCVVTTTHFVSGLTELHTDQRLGFEQLVGVRAEGPLRPPLGGWKILLATWALRSDAKRPKNKTDSPLKDESVFQTSG
jgi:hypothetical protein